MHIKGKRHKLTFKTKVDPEYDVKCSFKLIQSMKLKMWQQKYPKWLPKVRPQKIPSKMFYNCLNFTKVNFKNFKKRKNILKISKDLLKQKCK